VKISASPGKKGIKKDATIRPVSAKIMAKRKT
jgi:hypothetical protein